MTRIAIVQLLPIEYYPPVTNLTCFLAGRGDLEVRVFTVDNTRQRPAWACRGVDIERTSSPRKGESLPKRYARYLCTLFSVVRGLRRFRPALVLYFEPHSALPVYLYRRFLDRKVRVAIHHHEYYDPGQFERPGMRLASLAHRCEQQFLFSAADWISQTNETRRRLFLEDHPDLSSEKVGILPNYPPTSWQHVGNRAWSRGPRPLRLVYVGSVSREDTFLEPVVRWINGLSSPASITLDLYAYNVPEDTSRWLRTQESARFRFHDQGLDYEALPETLADYHVGLILYRGNTTNFVWNAPNKLFEYLCCGLDVWYPRVMRGIAPYRKETLKPGVYEVDFENPATFPLDGTLEREDLEANSARYSCEEIYGDWIQRLLAAGS